MRVDQRSGLLTLICRRLRPWQPSFDFLCVLRRTMSAYAYDFDEMSWARYGSEVKIKKINRTRKG